MSTPRKSQTFAKNFKQRFLRGFLVRFHMSLILSAVVASGVLSSKLLLMAGVHSLRLRYPIAVLISYAVFVGLIRVWLWYVAIRQRVALTTGSFDLGSIDIGGGGGGGSSGGVEFGGGSSGGGGASDVWGEPVPSVAPSGGGGGGGGWGDLSLDLDGEGILILILLAALILGVILAGGYLIYAAPEILTEAAWQFALAGALKRVAEKKGDWMPGFLKATVIPFGVVLVLATALGWVAQHHCPRASKLIQVFQCPAE